MEEEREPRCEEEKEEEEEEGGGLVTNYVLEEKEFFLPAWRKIASLCLFFHSLIFVLFFFSFSLYPVYLSISYIAPSFFFLFFFHCLTTAFSTFFLSFLLFLLLSLLCFPSHPSFYPSSFLPSFLPSMFSFFLPSISVHTSHFIKLISTFLPSFPHYPSSLQCTCGRLFFLPIN